MVWNYEWMATLVLLFFAVLILPIYLQTKITTVPEYMELRYDRRSRYVFSGFTVLTGMLIDTAGAMFAGAIVLQLLFPEVPLMVHIIVIAVLGGGYVIVGGLKAVMVTDTIQGVILLIADGGDLRAGVRPVRLRLGRVRRDGARGRVHGRAAARRRLPALARHLHRRDLARASTSGSPTTSSSSGCWPPRTSTTAAGVRCSPARCSCRGWSC